MRIPGILLVACLALSAEPQRAPDRFASIEGIVVRAGTGTPVGGAFVELTGIAPRTVDGSSSVGRGVISVSVEESASNGGVLSYTATTGRDGRFEIRNIRPGTEYQLVAMHFPDYLPAQFGQRIPAVPGRSIPLAQGDRLQDIRVELTPAGTISGQVVDSRGQGVRNVTVELRRPWYLEGWRLLVEWNELIGRVQGVGKSNRAGIARTNGRGEFSFAGLAPAQYYVRTDLVDEGTIKPVNLHAGASINDLKIVRPESGPWQVSGAIYDAGGAPITLAEVIVVPRNVPPLYQRIRVAAVPVRGGVFDVTVPGAGKYLLIARATGGRSVLRGRKEVEVRNTDLSGVRISVTSDFTISGTVAFEGSRMAADPIRDALLVNLYPASPEIAPLRPVRPSTATGSFTVADVTAGDYRVELSPVLTVPPSSLLPAALENVFVKSIRLDGKDILNGGLHIDGPVSGQIQIAVSLNGGAVEGRALEAGKPVANVNAVIVPDAPRRQRGDLYKYDSTDDSGRFRLTGLAPGDYKLFAFERVEEGAWQDPEFLRLVEDRGKAIHIDESGRVRADIEVVPAWN